MYTKLALIRVALGADYFAEENLEVQIATPPMAGAVDKIFRMKEKYKVALLPPPNISS